MKRKQTGFTMIELIVVIVILGILAATALPKFIEVQSNAKDAALKGMVGTMASAMQMNYSGCTVVGHDSSAANAKKCIKVNNCSDVNKVLQSGAVPQEYSVTAKELSAVNGTTEDCTVTLAGATAPLNFKGISAGN